MRDEKCTLISCPIPRPSSLTYVRKVPGQRQGDGCAGGRGNQRYAPYPSKLQTGRDTEDVPEEEAGNRRPKTA